MFYAFFLFIFHVDTMQIQVQFMRLSLVSLTPLTFAKTCSLNAVHSFRDFLKAVIFDYVVDHEKRCSEMGEMIMKFCERLK